MPTPDEMYDEANELKNQGDLEGAVDHLRKQGLKSAAKKASRETAEGRVFASMEEACQRDLLLVATGEISNRGVE